LLAISHGELDSIDVQVLDSSSRRFVEILTDAPRLLPRTASMAWLPALCTHAVRFSSRVFPRAHTHNHKRVVPDTPLHTRIITVLPSFGEPLRKTSAI
jgi:hypothetical protein